MQLLLRDRQQHRNSMGGCKGGGHGGERKREREVVRERGGEGRRGGLHREVYTDKKKGG